MSSIFSENLRKARHLKGWTQGQAANASRILRTTFASYEEDRAFPQGSKLTSIAEALNVEDDLYGFINNRDFFEASKRRNIKKQSVIEKKYHSLKPHIRMAVDTLMGLSQTV